jgi:hypothetical protein
MIVDTLSAKLPLWRAVSVVCETTPPAPRRLLRHADALGDLGDRSVELGFEALHLGLARFRGV